MCKTLQCEKMQSKLHNSIWTKGSKKRRKRDCVCKRVEYKKEKSQRPASPTQTICLNPGHYLKLSLSGQQCCRFCLQLHNRHPPFSAVAGSCPVSFYFSFAVSVRQSGVHKLFFATVFLSVCRSPIRNTNQHCQHALQQLRFTRNLSFLLSAFIIIMAVVQQQSSKSNSTIKISFVSFHSMTALITFIPLNDDHCLHQKGDNNIFLRFCNDSITRKNLSSSVSIK